MDENKWADRVYTAGEHNYDCDPDIDAEVIVGKVISAALEELVSILDEEKPRNAADFVRRLIS